MSSTKESCSCLPYLTSISVNNGQIHIYIGEGDDADYWKKIVLDFLDQAILRETDHQVMVDSRNIGSFLYLEFKFSDRQVSTGIKNAVIVRILTMFYDEFSKYREQVKKEQVLSYEPKKLAIEVRLILTNRLCGPEIWWSFINVMVGQEGQQYYLPDQVALRG